MTQKFGSEESNDENSASTVKNAFATIHDYTNNKYTFVDSDHQFDLFKYGHVGTVFNTYKTKVYNTGDVLDTINGNPVWWSNVQVHNGWQDTLMTFTPGSYNPSLVNYTSVIIQCSGITDYHHMLVVQMMV